MEHEDESEASRSVESHDSEIHATERYPAGRQTSEESFDWERAESLQTDATDPEAGNGDSNEPYRTNEAYSRDPQGHTRENTNDPRTQRSCPTCPSSPAEHTASRKRNGNSENTLYANPR